ncbi:MAG: hypothetical protein ACRBDI_05930 [Alphaproteobacteria bacterium]
MKQLNSLFAAAENGDPDALYTLGTAYETILSSEENAADLAIDLKNKAAIGGHKVAIEELSMTPDNLDGQEL